MRQVSAIITFLAVYVWAEVCTAYDPGTHQNLADASARVSTLVAPAAGASTTVLQDLGLPSYTDQNQDLWFTDSQPNLSIALGPDGSPYTTPANGNVRALIIAGAAIEDDEYRSLCHFYDPNSQKPLQVLGLSATYSDPDWALGASSTGNLISGACSITLPVLGTFGQQAQQYSLTDANNYFYAALTSPNNSDRNLGFGNLFLSLGHALHLLEDMAQPQHVRNDMHCDTYKCLVEYNPSKYERDVFNTPYDISVAGNYTPDFSTMRGFWSGNSKGLADFTNLNFLSAGTLGWVDGGTVGYSSPTLAPAATTEAVATVYQQDLGNKQVPYEIAQFCNNQPNSCLLEFHPTSGKDNYTVTPVYNPRAASESIFNADLSDFGSHKVYTLNVVTDNAAWNLLQPMAVGYGAGMIDHFFRGRLSMHPDPSQPNGYVVTNLSAYALSNGTLTVYYDAADGTRYPVQNAAWSNVSMAKTGNDPADQFKIQITPPVDPAPANSGQYMIVFKGIISNDIQSGELGIAALQYKPNTDVYFGQNIQWNGNFEYQSNWEPNNAYEYAPDGTQVATHYLMQGALNAPWYMAVYDKNIYTADVGDEYGATVNEYTYPNYSAATRKVIAGGTDYYRQGGSLNEGIAVNDSYLLIPRVLQDHTISPFDYSVSVFDHAGNFLRNIPEPYLVDTISANDNHMCIALNEWDQHNIATLVELQDLNGNVTSNLMTIPASDSFFGIECASSRDRHYVLVQTIDYSTDVVSNQLYVYDEAGNQVYAMPITGPKANAASWQIASDGRNVYIAFDGTSAESQFGGVVVVNRLLTRDSGGNIVSETYQQAADIGDGRAAGGVAVDFANSN